MLEIFMGLKAEWQRLKWSLASEKKKQKLLDDACRLLRLWPETSALLDLAKAEGIGIRFDESLGATETGADTDGYLYRNRTTGACHIALKPCLQPRDIAVPLIHELRHLWQEKQLGLTPETAGLGEKDARTALILTRVKEADAFTFTDLMIGRINHVEQDLKDQQAFEKKLLAQSSAGALTPQQQNQVDDFLADRISSRIPEEKRKTEERFLKHLGTLDSYDRIAVGDYYRRYISSSGVAMKHMTEKDGALIGVSDIRHILKTGIMDVMPVYFDQPDDRAFVDAVLSGVKPAVLDAVSAMEAFEKAASRAPAAAETQRLRAKAGASLQKLPAP
jgi:hypothetical protein